MNSSNNKPSKENTSVNVPDTYTHRGAQTPTYNAPPIPKTASVKPSSNNTEKK